VIYAPVTFVVKGIEGYVTGRIANSSKKQFMKIIAVLVGALIIPLGYFVCELYFLRIFDNSTFGYTYAIAGLPGNTIQGLANAVLAYLLSILLAHSGIRNHISD